LGENGDGGCVNEREGEWEGKGCRGRGVGEEGVCRRVVEEVAVEVVDIVSEYPTVHWGWTTWGGECM
jgi:hypothetical protein